MPREVQGTIRLVQAPQRRQDRGRPSPPLPPPSRQPPIPSPRPLSTPLPLGPTPTPPTPPTQIPMHNLPTHINKNLRNILPPPRRRLIIRHPAPRLRDLERPAPTHHPVFLEITLIPHQHNWDIGVSALDLHDLLAQLGEFVEGGEGGDAEDEEEAVGVAHVEFAHRGELLGAGCVHDFEHDLAAVDVICLR
ncbi:hypothetical protein LTS16_005197 [Friedmanniomyces endolithicus]|nr:hypothetical protein LTR75_002932 [Friedmanniomyces endolithicus]KAK0974438.1 hypothetical protein LTS01_014207 [Friedmanniomyces endolithicus]KAK1047427.1 hypothetical protein LTS16_005197 [Friedmanniomyces endolithicus]